MRCPRDNSPLSRPPSARTAGLSCSSCQGLWLPVAEFRQRTAGATCSQAQLLGPAAGCCPSCAPTRLQRVRLHGAEVEICQVCHGVWLEPAQLAVIRLWYLTQVQRRASAPRPVGDDTVLVQVLDGVLTSPEVVIELARLLGGAAKQAPEVATEAATAVVEFVGDLF